MTSAKSAFYLHVFKGGIRPICLMPKILTFEQQKFYTFIIDFSKISRSTNSPRAVSSVADFAKTRHLNSRKSYIFIIDIRKISISTFSKGGTCAFWLFSQNIRHLNNRKSYIVIIDISKISRYHSRSGVNGTHSKSAIPWR